MRDDDLAMVEQAVPALGWVGAVVGPVVFGGVRFWAAVQVVEPADGAESAIRLVGALLVGRRASVLQREASLLAAYTPRAILLSSAGVALETLVDAAVLDQGVVVHDGNEVRVLAAAGPRTWTGRTTAREQRLLDCLRDAMRRQESPALS